MRVQPYSRVSSREQLKGGNLQTHIAAITERLQHESSWQPLKGIYEQNSGDYDQLQGLQSIIEQVRKGDIFLDILLTYEFARLGRDFYEVIANMGLLLKAGIRVVATRDGFDSAALSQNDVLLHVSVAFKAAISDDERKTFISRTMAAKKQRIADGHHVITVPPYGFAKIGYKKQARFEVDPVESARIRQAMNLLEEGKRIGQIVSEWKLSGIKTRNGKEWTPQQLKAVLQNTALKGEFVYNKWAGGGKTWRKKYQGHKFKPESEWVRLAGPAILNPEEWARLQHLILIRTGERYSPSNSTFPLKGRVRCNCCPQLYLMSPDTRTDRRRKSLKTTRYLICHQCKRSITCARLEQWVWQIVWGMYYDPQRLAEAFKDYLGQMRERAEKAQQELERTRALLAEQKEEKKRLVSLYRRGKLTDAEYDEEVKDIDKALEYNITKEAQLQDEYHRLVGMQTIALEPPVIELPPLRPTPSLEVLHRFFEATRVKVVMEEGNLPKVKFFGLE